MQRIPVDDSHHAPHDPSTMAACRARGRRSVRWLFAILCVSCYRRAGSFAFRALSSGSSRFLSIPASKSFATTTTRIGGSAGAPSPALLATATHHPVDMDGQDDVDCIIKNFRPVAGICAATLFRCANPDGLADRLGRRASSSSTKSGADNEERAGPRLHPDEDLVLNRAGLVVDLRSDSERDPVRCRAWLDGAPGGAFRVVDEGDDLAEIARAAPLSPDAPTRFVLRLDPLHPDLLMSYLEENWMTRRERSRALWYKLVDGQALHDLRLDVLNRNGLAGLNRAVLVTGGPSLVRGLRAMTLHLERGRGDSSPFPPSPVVIHCVQGKDRTGMLSMLCQSVAGVDDETIVGDCHRSEACLAPGAAAVARAYPGRIDRRFFTGAPRRAMLETLEWIRSRYGGVDGYLDAMGFGAEWRSRLAAVLASPAGSGATAEAAAEPAVPELSKL